MALQSFIPLRRCVRLQRWRCLYVRWPMHASAPAVLSIELLAPFSREESHHRGSVTPVREN
jgi:hypothetical protein